MKFIKTGKAVEIIAESVKELSLLEGYPAMVRFKGRFFLPDKHLVIRNVVSRLIAALGKSAKVSLDDRLKGVVQSKVKLLDIPESFTYHTKPLPFQEIALRFLYTNSGGGLLLDPGMGKTKVILDFIKLMSFKKSLIVCPLSLCFVWEEEVRKHRPDLSLYVFKTTDMDKEFLENPDKDVYVLNYRKASLCKEFLMSKKWDFISLDEGLIKDHTTEVTKDLTEIRRNIPCRSISSGSLVTRSEMDVFAPVRFMEPSITGEYVTKFRSRFEIRKTMKDDPKRSFTVGFRFKDEIRSMLDASSIVLTKEEWLPYMPKKEFRTVILPMGEVQKECYDELQCNWIASLPDGSYLEIENPLTLSCKLSQIARGFVYKTSEIEDAVELGISEDGVRQGKRTRETIYFPRPPILDRMVYDLVTSYRTKRVIIWYNMQAELNMLSEALNEAQVTYLVIGNPNDDIGAIINEFNRNTHYQVILIQAQKVNYGVTIMGCDPALVDSKDLPVIPDMDSKIYTEFFYGMNFSLQIYLQQIDRIHRIGANKVCEYVAYLSDCDMDKRVYDCLQEKKTIKTSMLIDWANRSSETSI